MKFSNPKLVVLLVLTISLSVFTSCTKDEVDIAKEVVYVYNGTFNSTDFQSLDYDVTVTKVNNNTIKITPEDSHGTSFEVTITSGNNGVYNGSIGQVVFSDDAQGDKMLVYNKDGEQFVGVHQ